MIVLVTPAQQALARLDGEIADRLGEARDPRMEAIATAPVRRKPATLNRPTSREPEVGTARAVEHMRALIARLRELARAEQSPTHGLAWDAPPEERVERVDEFRKLIEELDRELASLSGHVERLGPSNE